MRAGKQDIRRKIQPLQKLPLLKYLSTSILNKTWKNSLVSKISP